ncbi:MAG: hypothetical protein HY938_03590 [Nitrosomonadales bacterium]|nr:hypothetical protein [Nitrosomonadales bacterium]
MNISYQSVFRFFFFVAIACLGLERINVLPWSGSFIQISYLLSIPFLWVMWQAKYKSLQICYVVIMLVLATSLLANGLFNTYYWKKVVLIGYVLAASFSLAAYAYKNNLEEPFIKALKIYVLLSIVVTFLQLIAFLEGDFLTSQLDPTRIFNFDAIVIGDYFRPSGYSFDSNKGMFNFSYALICLSLISEGGWRWMKIMYPLTFLAHSRSTLVAIVPALFARSKFYGVLSVALYIMVLMFLTPQQVAKDRLSSMNSMNVADSTISSNLSFGNSSSNYMRLELAKLWARSISSASPEQILFGHGIASSGVYLNKNLGTSYGDFANGYLTIFFELGLAGLALLVAILTKLWRAYNSRGRYMLLIPLMIFQLFYANLAEPLVIVTLSYLLMKYRENVVDELNYRAEGH